MSSDVRSDDRIMDRIHAAAAAGEKHGTTPGAWMTRPTEELAVFELLAADSPRLDGVDIQHAQLLADLEGDLPPILVNRRTMRVIDGMHRLRAAMIGGQEKIQAKLFDGTDDDAFLLAVKMNTTHGLRLTLADRRAAAERIIRSHSQLSDRAIAASTGLAARTVATIRRRSTDDVPQSNVRLGQDGRARPMDSSEGRRVASKVIAAHPAASLRKIAKEAGISISTARDVRQRIRAGDDPAPARRHALAGGAIPEPVGSSTFVVQPSSEPGQQSILDGLRRDPSLRYTDFGRSFLRWLSSRTVTRAECRRLANDLSPHCAILVGKIAQECASTWAEFAYELDRRSGEHT